jgi:hypothetical protein
MCPARDSVKSISRRARDAGRWCLPQSHETSLHLVRRQAARLCGGRVLTRGSGDFLASESSHEPLADQGFSMRGRANSRLTACTMTDSQRSIAAWPAVFRAGSSPIRQPGVSRPHLLHRRNSRPGS